MKTPSRILANTTAIELWPAHLLRARGNRDARALARSTRVLRRKRDGCYLAAELPEGLLPLVARLMHEPGIEEALDALEMDHHHARAGLDVVPELPFVDLHERLDALGIDADDYEAGTGLELVAEPAWLALAGEDRYRRPLWLRNDAARAWHRMQSAAMQDAVVLDAISGYRSHDYQLGIFNRKRERGQTVADILSVNAAPGYSEHHSGLALDIGTPGEPAAEESFDTTDAFAWLQDHARAHGFAMSYPRDNPHGIVYEPWHWRYAPLSDRAD